MTSIPRGWAETALHDVVKSKSGNSKLIKGKLAASPGEGLFPAYSASGQDVWCAHANMRGPELFFRPSVLAAEKRSWQKARGLPSQTRT